METPQNIHTYRFYKNDAGRWYVDIPEWKGLQDELEMVEGADTMLEYVGLSKPEVVLSLAEEPFLGASELKLIRDCSAETDGGGIYLLDVYDGETIEQEMWLCAVTNWVFGKLPAIIYFKKEPIISINLKISQ